MAELYSAGGGVGSGGNADRLADAERMLGGTRERLGRLADRLAELRLRLGAGVGGAAAGSQGADAEDPPAR